MEQRLLAIDPGLTHGWARWNEDMFHAAGQTTEPNVLFKMIENDKLTVVVIEDFVGGGPRNQYAIHTLKMIGGFEWVARRLGIRVAIHGPIIRKPYMELAKQKGYPIHATDAIAHALAFLRTGK